jgi:carbonic anhydrase
MTKPLLVPVMLLLIAGCSETPRASSQPAPQPAPAPTAARVADEPTPAPTAPPERPAWNTVRPATAATGDAHGHATEPVHDAGAGHGTPAPKGAAHGSPSTAHPASAGGHAPAHGGHAAGPPPSEALAALVAGNYAFRTGNRTRSAQPTQDDERRQETAKGQHPFAAVLTCADSRLSPELIFDQSLGDVFVVRNAGNVAEPVGEGSLEYAVEHLGVRLIVVLGHGKCGAVTAVAGAAAPLPGNLKAIQDEMPGLADIASGFKRANLPAARILDNCIAHNAEAQARALLTESAVLREAVANGAMIVPAVYQLDSGVVRFAEPVR